jgi:uncharacterized protein (TIGR02145 family)
MVLLSKFFFKITLIVLVGLLGASCTPEYLRPSLPGKIPLVKSLPNQNQVFVNCKTQLKASCYSIDRPDEVGFLVSSNSGIMENGQGVEKIIFNNYTLTNEDEYLFDSEYSVGSVPGLIKYCRPFSKNSRGIGYGEEFNFITTVVGILPTLTTTSMSWISDIGATSGGNVTCDGGTSVTARGVAYGTEYNPTTANSSTSDGTGTGVFTSKLSGLSPSTLYYVRAYATNAVGTAYGNQVSFSTLPWTCGISSVFDLDNNSYSTVQIGTQCWIKSNLRASKYSNGENIPTGLSNSSWFNTWQTRIGAYAFYNNDPRNDDLYGKLYNHYAVTDGRGLCPTGWHVPLDAEWTTLENHLGGGSVAGGALKSMAIQPTPGGWELPNSGATNSSGFTALPGGFRNTNGDFYNVSTWGYWWSSPPPNSWPDAWYRRLNIYNSEIQRPTSLNQSFGFSVRCLKD